MASPADLTPSKAKTLRPPDWGPALKHTDRRTPVVSQRPITDRVKQLWKSSYKGDLEEVEAACRVDPGAVFVQSKDGYSAFHFAAENGQTHIIRYFLEELHADNQCLNMKNAEGHSPLCIAARRDHGATINYMIGREADINIRSKDGETPLYIAAESGRGSSVRALLDAGADPRIRSKKTGQMPSAAAVRFGYTEIGGWITDKEREFISEPDLKCDDADDDMDHNGGKEDDATHHEPPHDDDNMEVIYVQNASSSSSASSNNLKRRVFDGPINPFVHPKRRKTQLFLSESMPNFDDKENQSDNAQNEEKTNRVVTAENPENPKKRVRGDGEDDNQNIDDDQAPDDDVELSSKPPPRVRIVGTPIPNKKKQKVRSKEDIAQKESEEHESGDADKSEDGSEKDGSDKDNIEGDDDNDVEMKAQLPSGKVEADDDGEEERELKSEEDDVKEVSFTESVVPDLPSVSSADSPMHPKPILPQADISNLLDSEVGGEPKQESEQQSDQGVVGNSFDFPRRPGQVILNGGNVQPFSAAASVSHAPASSDFAAAASSSSSHCHDNREPASDLAEAAEVKGEDIANKRGEQPERERSPEREEQRERERSPEREEQPEREERPEREDNKIDAEESCQEQAGQQQEQLQQQQRSSWSVAITLFLLLSFLIAFIAFIFGAALPDWDGVL